MNEQADWSELEIGQVQKKSVVVTAKSLQPLKLLNPKAYGNGCHVVLSSYGGGMVAGDKINLRITCAPHTTLFLNTQASTKIFKSLNGEEAEQHLMGQLAENSLAVVFPDPVVLQEESRYRQLQHWKLHPEGALLLVADWFHSGRMELGEKYLFHSFFTELKISIGDKLVLLDRFSFSPAGNIATSPANFDQYQTMLSVYLAGSPSDPRFSQLGQKLMQLKMKELSNLNFDMTSGEVVVSVSRVKEEVYLLRAMARNRIALQPLCDALFKELATPELLGYNPVQRKY